MKKRITVGARGWLLASLIFIYISCLGLNDSLKSESEKIASLIESQAIFDENNSGEMALQVLSIVKGNIRIDDHHLYFVETPIGIVALEADRNDPEVNRLFTVQDKLKSGQYYIGVETVPKTERRGSRYSRRTVTNITPELMMSLAYDLGTLNVFTEQIDSNHFQFITQTYASRTRYWSGNVAGFWVSLLLLILGLSFIAVGYFIIIANVRNYKKLHEIFPESKKDLSLIVKHASFHDNTLKLLVFRDYLIAYYKQFRLIPLKDIHKINLVQSLNEKNRPIKNLFEIRLYGTRNTVLLARKIQKKNYNRANDFIIRLKKQLKKV